jgi:hypothetical protein
VAAGRDRALRIVAIAAEANVPLMFVSPVANLEWAPFKSEHRPGLTTEQLAQFEKLRQEASELYARDVVAALEKLTAAQKIDDEFAELEYDIGLALLELGRRNEAEQALHRAKELDVCPLRILTRIQQIIHQVASESKTPLVDAQALFADLSRTGFPDKQWLIDHVHPTIEGHQRLADAIADKLVELDYIEPDQDWIAAKEAAYQKHLASLSHVYFDRARSRLKSEQGWAHGQVKKIKPKSQPTTP